MSNPSPFWSLPLGQVPTTDVPATGAAPAAAPAPAAPAAPAGAEQAPPAAVGPNPANTSTNTSQPDKIEKPAVQKPTPSFWENASFPLLIGGLILVFMLMSRGQRKEEKRRKQMVSEMKKGDRVMTIGGLVARIVSIDNDEVVLKIDESANVKATYKKSSIQQVLVPGDEKTK